MVPFSSVTTISVGIVCTSVSVASRSARSSSSWRLRSVMSMPPAMMPTTAPVSSVSGALAPGDHERLAASVGERVLVLGGRELGRRGVEARAHRDPLVRVDEDVPEVEASHRVRIREAARAKGRGIEADDLAGDVDVDEQARRGVDDRREEVVLTAQLGLQPLVVERERDRRRDAADQRRLVLERPVVHERARPAGRRARRSSRRGRSPARAARSDGPRGRRSGRVARASTRARARDRRARWRSPRAAAALARSRRRARRRSRARAGSGGCRTGTRTGPRRTAAGRAGSKRRAAPAEICESRLTNSSPSSAAPLAP